jgi:anti-sigma regulatory factor (Ser/Thr protein kinase)
VSGQRCERKRFPAVPEQVRQARRFIREALGEDFSHIEDAVLVVSELATNAVIRAMSIRVMSQQEGSFEVAFLRCDDWALITVSDQGLAILLYQNTIVPDEEGSRGLEIVDTLALRWGFTRDQVEGGLVWCELGEPDHRPAPERVAWLLWHR